MPKLKFAMVCASNQNRSMEAHALLKKQGFDVESFGVGAHVKLPGPTQQKPNVYEFGTPYEQIYNDLAEKDPQLYTRNGLLQMLRRNMGVKTAPERFQDNRDVFHVVMTFEERVMDQVIEDFNTRTQVSFNPVLIINIDVKDNHDEAANAAPHAMRLCQMLEEAEAWEDEVDNILNRFQFETGRRAIHHICFY